MRLGIGSYTYGWAVGTEGSRPPLALSASGLIERARELGVGLVQLCDNLPAESFLPAEVARISDQAARAGIELEMGTRGSDPAHLAGMAGIARDLGARLLRVVIDAPGDHPEPEEAVRRIGRILPDLERAGVVLAIENHDRFRCGVLVEIIERLGSPRVGICLDTANSFGAMEGPEVVVEALGPHAVNLHLKDFEVRRMPHSQGFTIEGRALGEGMLDAKWLLRRLRELGREMNAIIELWTPPEPTIEATIEKESRWARASVGAARRWIPE